MKAISVKPPWAWAIVKGFKPVENRSRRFNHRGALAIHSSQSFTQSEYLAAKALLLRTNPAVVMPAMNKLVRGAVIGTVEVKDCVEDHPSPWFYGPFGLVLTSALECKPVPTKGKLGLWELGFEPQQVLESIVSPAIFSPCRRWRYTLFRSWADLFSSELRSVQFICLNPSTADETNDDPTVRRCIGFAREWGFNSMWMTNLFGFRSTDPNGMLFESDPVGPDNNRLLLEVAKVARLVVCAWGNHGQHLGRAAEVGAFLRASGIKLHLLSRTSTGEPGHPLYLPAILKPKEFQ